MRNFTNLAEEPEEPIADVVVEVEPSAVDALVEAVLADRDVVAWLTALNGTLDMDAVRGVAMHALAVGVDPWTALTEPVGRELTEEEQRIDDEALRLLRRGLRHHARPLPTAETLRLGYGAHVEPITAI